MVSKLGKLFSGIPRGKLTHLGGESNSPPLRTKDVTPVLIQIYNEEKAAEYAGGTLVFEFEDKPIMVNIGRGINEEENCLSAMIYCKHKSTATYHYAEALSIIEGREDMREEIVKMLLVSE